MEKVPTSMTEKLLIDAAVATPVVTMPWWLHMFEQYIQFGITVTTLIVVLSRLYVIVKEWKGIKNVQK
tara:strand:+ start:210 stop:413 length:204 start_codon:yes stop_codon:yes gene_type:complete